jgi:exodeoxyribonuclease VII large subunit
LALPDAHELRNHLNQLRHRSDAGIRNRLRQIRQRLENLANSSPLVRPHELHKQRRQQVDDWELRAHAAMWNGLRNRRESLASLARATEALSPLNVLARGYSLTQRSGSQQPLHSNEEVNVDDEITTMLAKGKIKSRVVSIED